MKFSVIIPTWNEGRQIAQALRRLREVSDNTRMELILVDGGSTDATVEEARRWVDKLEMLREPNRGAQLHAGTRYATGELFFFLHADAQPPKNWQERLEQFWLTDHPRKPAATVFSVDYGSRRGSRLAAWARNARPGFSGVAGGDGGFCTTREIYAACGGFPEIPLMEDLVFSRRLGTQGEIVVLPERILVGAGRIQRYGPLRIALHNAWLRTCFALGVSPQTLWKHYHGKVPEGVGPALASDVLKRKARSS